MRISWLIVIAFTAPLLAGAGPELRDGPDEVAPCVLSILTTEDGSSSARDLDAMDSETAADAREEAGQLPPCGLRAGLFAQRSGYSPAWAGVFVAKAEERASFAEVDAEPSIEMHARETNPGEINPRETNPRRERWKRIGIGVLHVLDFLAELYLEIH